MHYRFYLPLFLWGHSDDPTSPTAGVFSERELLPSCMALFFSPTFETLFISSVFGKNHSFPLLQAEKFFIQ